MKPRAVPNLDEGNFIEATEQTHILQIAEHKYGKPILAVWCTREMRLGEVAKLTFYRRCKQAASRLSSACHSISVYSAHTDVGACRRIEEND